MSTHMRTSPFRFGVSTSGDTHGVGPSTFSMMPLVNASLTFCRMWNGTRRGCCATVWSMCSLTSTFFSWPMPLKSVGNFSANAFWGKVPLDTPVSREFREPLLFCSWAGNHGFLAAHERTLVVCVDYNHQTVQACTADPYANRRLVVGCRTILRWLTLLKVSSSRMSVDAPVSTTSTSSMCTVTVGILDLSWPVVYRYSSSLLLVSSLGMTVQLLFLSVTLSLGFIPVFFSGKTHLREVI